MTSEEELLLNRVKYNFERLLEYCNKIVVENQHLQERIVILENHVADAEYEKRKLEDKYKNLKVASVISMSDKAKEQTKNRISKMVREIDKCIAQLSV